MIFSTMVFTFLFLPIVLIGYYNPIIKNRNFRNILLVIVSLVFYAWGQPSCVFLMILSIVINYIFAYGISYTRIHSVAILVISICWNVGILFVFKYLSYILGLTVHKELNIILPVGISFYTFQAMSYVIDVYRGRDAEKNIMNVALYIALFPQLVAGPIVRYSEISNQIYNRNESVELFSDGVKRYIVGLAKKVLLSNNLAQIVDYSFNNAGELSIAMAWLGAIGFTLQIYFDFSGYSDMAIGLGKMFGFKFSENFNYPYIAKSVTEFWRRWHISLSTWFRDYVYIPLGGNRCSTKRHLFNLAIVWLATGIWHGANLTFLIWGCIYFLILVLEKYTNGIIKIPFINRIYTLLVVVFLWVIFRADNLRNAYVYITSMFGGNSNAWIDANFISYLMNYKIYIIVAVIASTPIVRSIRKMIPELVYNYLADFSRIMVFLYTITYMISSTYNPFIYFNF